MIKNCSKNLVSVFFITIFFLIILFILPVNAEQLILTFETGDFKICGDIDGHWIEIPGYRQFSSPGKPMCESASAI